jgi:uncharacterized RDD family membrane protein YckC
MSSPRQQAASWVTLQGHYAGSVSRLVAYAIDVAVSCGLFAVALAAVSYATKIVPGRSVTWSRESIGVAVIFTGWQLFYLGYSWAAGGRTVGMAALGVRVVRADGSALGPRRAAARALAFPLSFIAFGLGFAGILVQREHRALHDLIAGTAVVYSWDARAARLRFLAHEAQADAGSKPRRDGPSGNSQSRPG